MQRRGRTGFDHVDPAGNGRFANEMMHPDVETAIDVALESVQVSIGQ